MIEGFFLYCDKHMLILLEKYDIFIKRLFWKGRN